MHISTELKNPEVRSYVIITKYHRDLTFKFKDPLQGLNIGGYRNNINIWSDQSIRRLKFHLRNSIHLFTTSLTLTYPSEFPCSGKISKKHLNVFLGRLRRLGFLYTWVQEFQLRGAPHYHIVINGNINKYDLSEWWYNIVGSSDNRHLLAGTRIEKIRDDRDRDRIINYLLAYVSKKDQKTVPSGYVHVGRFWGSSRGLLKVIERVCHRGSYRAVRGSIRPFRKLREKKILKMPLSSFLKKQALKRNGKRSFILWNGSGLRI